MKIKDLSRRELIKNSLLGTAVFATAGIVGCSKKEDENKAMTQTESDSSGADAGPEYVSEDNNMAQSLGYKEKASEVDASVRVDKGETKGSEQYCSNCQFYTAVDNEGGKCTLFPGKLVKKNGWCKSWQLKAEA